MQLVINSSRHSTVVPLASSIGKFRYDACAEEADNQAYHENAQHTCTRIAVQLEYIFWRKQLNFINLQLILRIIERVTVFQVPRVANLPFSRNGAVEFKVSL